MLAPGIDFVTLCQWYNQQNVARVREVYLKTPAGIKGGKGSTFSLELFIHKDRVSASMMFHGCSVHRSDVSCFEGGFYNYGQCNKDSQL